MKIRENSVLIAMLASLYGCGGSGGSITDPLDRDNTGPAIGVDNPDIRNTLAADSADEVVRNSLIGYYTSLDNAGRTQSLPQVDAVGLVENADSADGAVASSQSRFSDTNVQEQGVDESDRVKIDGDVMFALEKPDSLYWNDTAVPFANDVFVGAVSTPVSLPVETLSAYRLDGENSAVLSRLPLDSLGSLGGYGISGMYLHKNGVSSDLVLLSEPSFSIWDSWGSSAIWSGGETQISWVDASNPESLSVNRTMNIQGSLISSRRIGNQLILVTRYFPQVDNINPYPVTDSDVENNRVIINNADINDVLPQLTVSENGSAITSQLIESDNACYTASTADNQQVGIADTSVYYPSPNIISIVNIDLNNPGTSVDSTCFVGDSETMYVSPESIYLATTQYKYGFVDTFEIDNEELVVELPAFESPINYSQIDITTDIHKFSLNGSGAPQFRGSGSVSGHLGWNPDRKPFRMSEKNGDLRIVSFDESRVGSPVTLSILRESNGVLSTVSTLPNESRPEDIGKPGESLYASRFIGNKAYLVTFRVNDPLYVLDVSNPADPRVEGEIEIPGYSDYLHPVNDSLLIGLGKDAIPVTNNNWGDGRGAWFQGVKLALYDVADPSNPFVADERIMGKRYTESPALTQHYSFAYLAGEGDRNARFAFPLSLHDETPYGPTNSSDWTSNNLVKMEVDENSRRFVDVPEWEFETRISTGINRSPISLYSDRAVIGADGDVYYIHNGTLNFGQWTSSEPASSINQ